ncbi:MAG: hypothetical protein LBC85_09935 [Fibromonadaceae bacterium]|jgi:hypothetical protein|nr:hypothetical protein [Fibromonadaceae bacterium]
MSKKKKKQAKPKKVRYSPFDRIDFCEDMLLWCALFGVAGGTGTIIVGLYMSEANVIRTGVVISLISLCCTIYLQHKLDKARDAATLAWRLFNKHGKFMGNPEQLKQFKDLHAQQMEKKAKEEQERYLDEKSKNKKLLEAEKRYEKLALEQLSKNEREKRLHEKSAQMDDLK